MSRVLGVFRLCLHCTAGGAKVEGQAGGRAYNGFQRSADDMHKLHMKGASAGGAGIGAAVDAAFRLQSTDLCSSLCPYRAIYHTRIYCSYDA